MICKMEKVFWNSDNMEFNSTPPDITEEANIPMRERLNAVDKVGRTTLNQATPIILCKSNEPMERAKNGARYFRNPPQPHMCIQDFILGCKEPCYINVLSWIKISTPRRPEDPIPLYGGMRIPYNNTSALSIPNDKKKQPIIFAVMANPEILRLSGKTAKDPMDRDALVDLMIDFVEAMNPEVKFNRQFSVLKDRDLTGELKDIWLAIQVKREKEKEKAENGRKLETQEKHKGEVKTSEHGQESESYWLETDRSKKLGLEVVESETRNIVLPHNETKLQGNSIIEGPTTPSPKNSPTHQRKSKIRSSKGELFTQTVQHYDRKSGGDSNIDVHVSEFCTVTKQTVFREIFPSSSDSSEDEDRGDFRLSNSPANSIKLHDGDLGMDDGPSIGTNSTHKSVSVEEASSPGNSDVEAHNVKPCKFLRMKSSSVKKSIEKQGKQSVHVANKFKNHDKGDCDTVARF